MMGGLGAVAGPQLRFQNTGAVPPVEEIINETETSVNEDAKHGLSGFFNTRARQKKRREAARKDPEFIKYHENLQKDRSPFSKFMGGIEGDLNRWLQQKDETRTSRQTDAGLEKMYEWFFGSDEGVETAQKKLEEARNTDPDDISVKDLPRGFSPESTGGEEVEVETKVTGETVDELGGEDPYLGEGYQGFEGFEEIQTKKDDPPKVKKEKEKKQKEKWGPNWGLISVGMNLMRGTEAGLRDASAIVKDLPTEGDKEMAKLKKDYLKAKTESEKAKASHDFLKMQWDREYKNTELGVKISRLSLDTEKQNWANVKTILEGMSEQQKMSALNLTAEQAEELEDHPERASSILGKKNFEHLNTIRRYLAGKQPFPTVAKEPEEEASWYEFWKKEGGVIPDSLRDAGVTSIRKI
tara:strand:- start:1492 stop:2724 length:1233 start_codon:yes stop_codon:yes gene_type:complete